MNNNFGAQNQVVPFVIFTNAGLDPWIGHGVSEYDVEHGEVIFLYCKYLLLFYCWLIKTPFKNSLISDQVAGAELTSIRQDEPIELVRAKERIFETLVLWSERR